MRYFGLFLLLLLIFGITSITINTCGTATKMVNNGINTAYKEFKPEELLRKYEWFKDAHAQLDAKQANIAVYNKRFNSLKSSYGKDSNNRKEWTRDDRESFDQWQSELSGVVASYNDLAAEYNSQMSKFNWRFCNKGNLPEGATETLPREYVPYK